MSVYADKAGETSRWVVKASDESLFLSYPYLNFPDKCRKRARKLSVFPRNILTHPVNTLIRCYLTMFSLKFYVTLQSNYNSYRLQSKNIYMYYRCIYKDMPISLNRQNTLHI